MRALAVRDLMVIARRPAFFLAMCVHAALLAGFIVVWGHGMPHMPGRNAYEQQRLVQWLTLGVLLPWTAARCLPREDRSDVALLALLTAVRPSRVLLARMCAGFVALGVLVASGLPAVVLAQQVAGLPMLHVLQGFGSMLSLVALASSASVLCGAVWSDQLTAWLAATGASVGLLLAAVLLVPPGITPWLFWVVASIAALMVMRDADVSMRHLPEDAP